MTVMQPAVVNFSAVPHSVEMRDVPEPSIGEWDCLVEVAAVGVCGSDLHQWTGDASWPVRYPVVLGHEFAGSIVEVGSRVEPWKPGDRVTSETAAVIDAHSPLSRQGRYNLDPSRKGFGYGVDGAMTRRVRVPARCLHRVPDRLPLHHAALTEPCCVAYSAVVANVSIVPADRVVVFGPGPIGILSAAIARLRGAEVAIVGLQRDEARLAIARRYGCQTLLPDQVDDWARAVDGLGADGVVDAAGVSATLKSSMEIVRPGGWISKVGWGPQPLQFSLDPIVQKNVTLQGSFSHTWNTWEKVLRLLSTKQLDVEPIIGGRWPIDAWHDAFEAMHSGQIVKAVLQAKPSSNDA
jgi:L-iditol 2-dehydrogenase